MSKMQISPVLNLQTARWVNEKHRNINGKAKLIIQEALELGKALKEYQKESGFVEWVEENITFTLKTAYKYISLFNYRNQITNAENITEAYKMIETFEAQKKQKETAGAYERVKEYNKTGKKPEGWRRGTDDKLAKEEADRDARIEAVKQEALSKNEQKEKEQKDKERQKAETEALLNFLDKSTQVQKKRSEFKERIRLSAEGKNEPFNDAIIDYLDGLEDDNRRIEACNNIIKICRGIANKLQGKIK